MNQHAKHAYFLGFSLFRFCKHADQSINWKVVTISFGYVAF